MSSTTDIEHPDCITRLLPEEFIARLAGHLAAAARMGFGFFDKEGIKVSLVSPNQDFCDAACGNDDEMLGYCRKTREKLASLHSKALKSGKLPADASTHHTCFLGFSCCVRSILLEGDTIGYIIAGPYLTPDYELPPPQFMEKMRGITAGQLEAFYSDLKKSTPREISDVLSSASRIVDMLVEEAYKVTAANQMQFASMEENYRMLLEKNRELKETKARLEEIDKLKSNLLSTISHELRTPLTSIIGYSDMLLGETVSPLSEEHVKYVRTINEKGGELLDMINKILDVASLEAGRYELSRDRFPAGELVEAAIERVKSYSSRQDVKIEYAAPEENYTIFGDPRSVEKALLYVIDNAVKFSPPGGTVQIGIRKAVPESEDGGGKGFVIMAPTMKSVEIMVRDFGPGIPETMKDKIFEPFFQADDTTTRSYGGLGLGLALVKQYIWSNGGSISVESQEGAGSTFYIRLPLQE